MVLLLLGALRADEFAATLTKVEDGKVTFTRGTGKKKKVTTLPADAKCRIVAARYDAKTKRIESGDLIAEGFKSPLFSQLDKGLIDAWICTDPANERILELRLFQSIAKKKKK